MTEESSPTEPARPSDRSFPYGRRASRIATAILAGAIWSHPAVAQTTDDTQLWLSSNTQGFVRGPYRVSFELHARWRDDVQHYERTVLRLQGGRTLTTRLTTWF